MELCNLKHVFPPFGGMAFGFLIYTGRQSLQFKAIPTSQWLACLCYFVALTGANIIRMVRDQDCLAAGADTRIQIVSGELECSSVSHSLDGPTHQGRGIAARTVLEPLH
eukprot:3253015-Amphidinium_carterae.1